MSTFLEFEKPIQQVMEQMDKLNEVAADGEVDIKGAMRDLTKKLAEARKQVYGNLTAWQRVQVSRHPDRPYTMRYINHLTDGNFIELHGDRTVKDDKAMVGGFGMMDGKSVMFIGQQKGVNTKMRQFRNFGMPNPEGYRKALRLMKLAEKFNKPVVTLIDTPGAFPGLEAEERGQGEAIARNLLEMSQLRVPIVCVVVGEGASGGALGIGLGDHVMMLVNSWYSVISPENCSTILWRTWDFKEKAAEALKLTAEDMLGNGLVDSVVPEPLGGAHADPDEACRLVKAAVVKQLEKLVKLDPDKRIERRIAKYGKMGVTQKAR
jgi:acetyl-CoA carboxylase carboxyl transferase subunit alpha